ncbi:MAG: ATP-dependent RNA helicase [Gammaproteobacteria bacterium]|nr:ATP-dependent RNA helicase [Gammaproteobacteria bacterium]HBF06635.1 ATP-dependent RNA helicase [Gammaproteobacteria bacterium]|tara:strand:- start:1493 stop:3292 length:1800 start_codon:yes stop_codon:yes gene_type:complete
MTDKITFKDLELAPEILQVLEKIGYESPSPIQEASIPHLLNGEDILGVAQTGTGKTAAFALPLLSNIDCNSPKTQILVLAPTRELAIQVAEAFQTYASKFRNFKVLPIYGGSNIGTQLRQLKQGAQVVVGTPGRVMDHLRRNTLNLDHLKAVVLDEADEMLRMGFIDDVTWILDQTPDNTQVALFSATMPRQIRAVAEQYLKSPKEVRIQPKESTKANIEQSYWTVNHLHKLDALTRILETEETDGIIMFVRTKNQTVELADKLNARGYSAAAINGDMVQKSREHTIEQLKRGSINILVATDVAARGIDVERISHVMNFDIPYDAETYVHRIGRTGRAGRSGKAILFISPRERHLLRTIERTTKTPITPLTMPTREDVNNKRQAEFTEAVSQLLDSQKLEQFETLIQSMQAEMGTDPARLAAALAYMAQKDKPLFLDTSHDPVHASANNLRERGGRGGRNDRGRGRDRDFNREDRGGRRGDRGDRGERGERGPRRERFGNEQKMDCYKISMGRNQNLRPSDIVGAIANEANLSSRDIGRIQLHDNHSTVELPQDLSAATFKALKKLHLRNQPIALERAAGNERGGNEKMAGNSSYKRRG